MRCDLFHHADQPHVFVGRKVFRGADALAPRGIASLPAVARGDELLLDAAGPAATLLTPSDASPFPLRTRWSTYVAYANKNRLYRDAVSS